MVDSPPGWTPFERGILLRAGNWELTRRRIRSVILWASLFAVALVAFYFLTRSAPALLLIALLYIAITTVEKVLYGRAVLVYKSVVTKLLARVKELEGEDT